MQREIRIRADTYNLHFKFYREGVTFETMQNLIGNYNFCIRGEDVCTKGTPVNVHWRVVDVNSRKLVSSGDRNTDNSNGWSRASVSRTIAHIR